MDAGFRYLIMENTPKIFMIIFGMFLIIIL